MSQTMLRSLLLLLSLIACDVLGTCCLPKKFFAVRVNILNGIRSNYFVDFDKQKILIKPRTPHDYEVEFFLKDLRQEKNYVQYKDGSCKFEAITLWTLIGKKVLVQSRTSDNYREEFILKDLGQEKTYIQYKDGSSKIFSLNRWSILDHCIPATATRGGSPNFGLPGTKMVTNQWTYQKSGDSIQMTVSAGKCFPVLRIAKSGQTTRPIAYYNTIVMYDTDKYFNQNLSHCVNAAETVG